MKTSKSQKTAESGDVAPPSAHTAPAKATASTVASPKKNAAKGKKGPTKPAAKKTPAKAAKKAAKAADAKKASTPRGESKGAAILALVRRSKGATQSELMAATGWQKHSVRGFLSNAAKKLASRSSP